MAGAWPWALLALLWRVCGGVVVRGSVAVPANGTSFLAKFCFDYAKDGAAGHLNISLRLSQGRRALDANLTSAGPRAEAERPALVVFDDQAKSYPDDSAAWEALSCAEKQQRAILAREFPPATMAFSSFRVNINEHFKPRWWYVAVADCTGSGLDLDYEVHMWNPLLGWQREFSMDHRGMLPLYSVLLAVHVAVCAAQCAANAAGSASGKAAHPLMRILTAGTICAVGSAVLFVAHYATFARNGQGAVSAYGAAMFLQAASKFLLMSILLLIARGQCVSRPLEPGGATRLVLLLAPFALLCAGLELWGEEAESRKYTTGFVYCSTRSGLSLVLVDLCWLAVLLRGLRGTYEREPDPGRRAFYSIWGLLSVAWFAALPAVALAESILAPWVRFRVAAIVLSSFHAVALALLVAALWPTRKGSHIKLDEVELVALGAGEAAPGECTDTEAEVFWRPLLDGPAA